MLGSVYFGGKESSAPLLWTRHKYDVDLLCGRGPLFSPFFHGLKGFIKICVRKPVISVTKIP